MNFKRSTTSMAIALMALSLVSMASVQQDAFGALGMSITATADKGSDIITVTGMTVSDITDVTYTVKSPSGNNVVEIGQLTPDDNGEFMITLKISEKWTEDGFYEIEVMQAVHQNSLYTLDVTVNVVNGMVAERTSETNSNLETGIFDGTPNVARNAGLILDDIIVDNGSSMFEVTGTTDRVSEVVTIQVFTPNRNLVTVAQVTATLDGEVTAEITVGTMWKENGFYTVTAYQNDNPLYTDSKKVEILDGVVIPEFGTIAAMILAVAIISIIAISAKSRLSIIPRY